MSWTKNKDRKYNPQWLQLPAEPVSTWFFKKLFLFLFLMDEPLQTHTKAIAVRISPKDSSIFLKKSFYLHWAIWFILFWVFAYKVFAQVLLHSFESGDSVSPTLFIKNIGLSLNKFSQQLYQGWIDYTCLFWTSLCSSFDYMSIT